MKKNLFLLLFTIFFFSVFAQTKTIHVFVALCDNEFQGIVPVPEKIGNGKDPKNNLYWGCGYGVKSFFKLKTKDWTLVKTIAPTNTHILERVLFKHATKDVYLLADAYDGEQIKPCTEDFLKASNGQEVQQLKYDLSTLQFGGGADLVAYVGHNGLMDFDVDVTYQKAVTPKDAILLGCYTQDYFAADMLDAQVNPILWTTHLMAPEAYTLKAAIDGWMNGETGEQIDERAAQAYNTYQKCGLSGARNLFTTGF